MPLSAAALTWHTAIVWSPEVLVSALGTDGRLDLAHARASLVRDAMTGWGCEQTSNAYVLCPVACEAHYERPVRSKIYHASTGQADGPPRPSEAMPVIV